MDLGPRNLSAGAQAILSKCGSYCVHMFKENKHEELDTFKFSLLSGTLISGGMLRQNDSALKVTNTYIHIYIYIYFYILYIYLPTYNL